MLGPVVAHWAVTASVSRVSVQPGKQFIRILDRHHLKHIGFYPFRQYSSTNYASAKVQNVTVDYGSKGPISLDVFHADAGSSTQPEPRSAILYLPAGPIGVDSAALTPDEQSFLDLSAAADVAVVKVNYRAGQGTPFPISIHDVLAGYDWVIQGLSNVTESRDDSDLPRIGVIGQLFGGGLAASLALTECHKGSQAKVVAAVLDDPIVDWAVPDRVALADASFALEEVGTLDSEFVKPKSKRPKSALESDSSWTKYADSSFLSTEEFMKARNRIFSSQNSYFDNFASPIHWFRTPGLEATEDAERMSSDEDEPAPPKLLRRYRLGYPPAGSGLDLPHFRLYSSESSILSSQHDDFMSHLRIAEMSNYLRARKISLSKRGQVEGDDSEIEYVRELADQKFVMQTTRGNGLFGSMASKERQEEIQKLGHWFKQFL